jgi:hypothetical protein
MLSTALINNIVVCKSKDSPNLKELNKKRALASSKPRKR